MKKEIYDALVDGYKRTRARAYASFAGMIIWLIFAFLHGDFTKSDGVVTILLICVCVVFCEVQQRRQLVLIKARKLGYHKVEYGKD